MEILRFAKWWWNKLDIHARILTLLIVWVLFMFVTTYIASFGMALAVFFAGLGLAGICFLLYLSYKHVRIKWEEYKHVKEMEADRIVGRLRGHV